MKQLLLQAPLVDHAPETLLRAYATIKLVKKKQEVKGIQRPLMAFKWNEAEICKAAEGNAFNAVEGWSGKEQSNFIKAYEEVVDMSIQNFVLSYLPRYVAQPTIALSHELGNDAQKEADMALSILYAKKVLMQSELRELPIPGYAAGAVGKGKIWRDFVFAVTTYPCSEVLSIKQTPMKAKKVFSDHGITDPELMIAAYLMAHAEESLDNIQLPINTNAAQLVGIQNAIDQAMPFLKSIACPTDYLSALQDNFDTAMENGYIYTRFAEQLPFDERSRVLIINPAPSFLEKYGKLPQMNHTTVAVTLEVESRVLALQFPTATFCTVADIEGCSDQFSHILFFGRNMDDGQIARILDSIMHLRTGYTYLQAAIPETFVVGVDKIIDGTYQIDIFPPKSFGEAPKRKVFLHAGPESTGQIKLCNYIGKKYLGERENIYVAKDSLVRASSIKSLFRQSYAKNKQKSRKRAIPYYYTPDIVFRFKARKKNETTTVYEAYACKKPTPKQIKRGSEGKMLPKTTISSSVQHSEEELYGWLENEVPYVDYIQTAIIRWFQDAKFAAEELSLKTLWYLQYDGKCDDVVRQLVCSKVGQCNFLDAEQFLNEMEAYCDNKSNSKCEALWRAVLKICKRASDRGFSVNAEFLHEYLRSEKKQSAKITAVKDSLADNGFSPKEEAELIKIIHEKIAEDSDYLSVLIRFYTGLPAGIIAALTWKDFQKAPGVDCCRLRLCKKYVGGSTEPILFENVRDYCYFPVCRALEQVLIAKKERMLQLCKNPAVLGELQIIAPDVQVDGRVPSCVIMPARINYLSRKVLKQLGRPENLIEIPTKDGMEEVDLANYPKDIFSTNFVTRTNEFGFNEGERCYVLRHQQRLPFPGNYCDYDHPISTLIMCNKLNRWAMSIEQPAQQPQARGTFCGSKKFDMNSSANQNEEAESILLQSLRLEMEGGAGTTIRISSENGVDVTATLLM